MKYVIIKMNFIIKSSENCFIFGQVLSKAVFGRFEFKYKTKIIVL